MCLAARYACRLIAMVRWIPLVAFLATVLGVADAVQAGECLSLKAGMAREIGRLQPDGGEKSYCVYARPGQTMKVTIKPLAPGIVTQGRVIFPLSHQSDGGPGGVIFNQKLSEEGRYEIRVGQRYEKKSGKFELSIELK
jgi:hypothetical protein